MTIKPVALSLLFASAAWAQAAAPSNEPVPSETSTKSSDEPDVPARLGGFDLALTVFNSTGVWFAPESYTNTLTLWLEPSFAIGKRLFKGRWLEPLTLSARIPFEFELTGADARFRGGTFASAQSFGEQLPIAKAQQPPAGQIDGTQKTPAILEDTWVSISDPKLFTIPKLKVVVGTGVRFVLPTSIASRNAGLITAGSWGAFVEREFGPVTVSYAARPTKYFFTRAVPAIHSTLGPVTINGQDFQPDQLPSTGVANPDWAVIHGGSIDVKLPKNFSVSAMYYLFHVAPLRSTDCTVPGVPTANVCTSGAMVGPVNPNAMRVDQWFLASLDWKTPILTASLGISTYRPLLGLNGKPAQPFAVASEENFTTLYLSLAASAEELAQLIRHPEKKP